MFETSEQDIISELQKKLFTLGYFKNGATSSLKDKFNIFLEIAEQYKRENLHSDILAKILNPKTSQIGNKKFLELFFKDIGLSDKEIKYFENTDDIKVTREKGHIDIAVYNDDYAIIIENKINKAVDQPNQLAVYYKRLTEDKYFDDKNRNVLKIVYIPLVVSRPDFSTYSKEYQKYINEISDRLFIFSAKSSDDIDIIHFLDKCIKQIKCCCSRNSILQKIFLEQYKQLLEYMGEKSFMSDDKKEIIKAIFSKSDLKGNTKKLIDCWNERGRILRETLKDDFKKDFGNEFEKKKIEQEEFLVKKNKNAEYKIYMTGYGSKLQMGFYMEKANEDINKLKAKITSISEVCIGENNIVITSRWMYFWFIIDDYTYDELKGKVKNIFEQLSN